MRALVFERNIPRFAASRIAATFGSGRGAGIGPLRLLDAEPPDLPADDWYHLSPLLSGICGSDLSTMDATGSRQLESLVSFPFVPGHEVVGVVADGAVDHTGATIPAGSRVAIEPVLGCVPRRLPPCPACTEGRTGNCEHITFGHLRPGLQTGFCADTGGGWSEAGLVAHASQLHQVPDDLTDEDAVMIEPAACAVHAALSPNLTDADEGAEKTRTVAILGAGTQGLGVIAALHQLVRPTLRTGTLDVVVGARHPLQRRLASDLGADHVVGSDELARTVRRQTGSLAVAGRLAGGADVVFDCVGSASSLAASLRVVRPRGRIVLVGMPGKVSVDLVNLWMREVELVGSYAYGVEHDPRIDAPHAHDAPTGSAGTAGTSPASLPRTFELAVDVVRHAQLGRLVSATYPLDRYEEALAHAGSAGRRGAVKVAFDLRTKPQKGLPR